MPPVAEAHSGVVGVLARPLAPDHAGPGGAQDWPEVGAPGTEDVVAGEGLSGDAEVDPVQLGHEGHRVRRGAQGIARGGPFDQLQAAPRAGREGPGEEEGQLLSPGVVLPHEGGVWAGGVQVTQEAGATLGLLPHRPGAEGGGEREGAGRNGGQHQRRDALSVAGQDGQLQHGCTTGG